MGILHGPIVPGSLAPAVLRCGLLWASFCLLTLLSCGLRTAVERHRAAGRRTALLRAWSRSRRDGARGVPSSRLRAARAAAAPGPQGAPRRRGRGCAGGGASAGARASGGSAFGRLGRVTSAELQLLGERLFPLKGCFEE